MSDNDAPSAALSPRAKRNLLIVVTLAAIVVMLLGAEAAVRVRSKIKYGAATTLEEYYTVDEKLGLRVARAGFSSGHISINSFGFRGPDIPMPKPPGTLRIAFLGASTTWCGEASGNEYVWPHLVTGMLAQRFPGAKFDYVNAGLPGYTMASILKNLQYRVLPLQPDVIIVYEAANNFSGEMRDLAAARGIIPEAKVHEFSWPSHYSLLWYLVEKNLAVQSSQRAARSNQARLAVDTSTIGGEYRDLLGEILRTAVQNARFVAIATFSTQLRRDQTPEQQMRAAASAFFYMPFATPALIMDGYDRYNEIARDVAREAGAVVIEGANAVPGDAAHFTDTVHFSDAGSRVMAQRIAGALIADPRFVALLPGEGSPVSAK